MKTIYELPIPSDLNEVLSGYSSDKINQRGNLILYYGLKDILFYVKDGKIELLTMCNDKLNELMRLHYLLPRDDEDDSMRKTNQIYQDNNKKVINNFLERGRFHFIKLVPRSELTFFCSLSRLRTYPKFDGTEEIYSLESISNFIDGINKTLVTNSIKITMKDSIIDLSIGERLKGNIMGGYTNSSNKRISIFDIVSVSVIKENPYVESLRKGVVRYKGRFLTLNRDILEKYYGNRLYKELESLNTRYRYCLEDTERTNLGVRELLNKYNLNIDAVNRSDLAYKLTKLIKPIKGNRLVARVLTSNFNHYSFYMTIDLTKVNDKNWEVINDFSIRPITISGISKSQGYVKYTTKAHTIYEAMKSGKKELNKLYGDIISISTNCFDIKYDEQFSLLNSCKGNLRSEYKRYSEVIRGICKRNKLSIPSDDVIKYLFANKISLRPKQISDIVSVLVQFLEIISDDMYCSKCLRLELVKIISDKVQKDLIEFEENRSLIELVKPYARYKLTKNGSVSKTVDLYHNNEYLCTKYFRMT